jgi:hypothetical protein
MLNKLINKLIFAIIFSASPFALGQTTLCPSPKQIKETAFTIIEKGDHPDVWTLIQRNKYNTPYRWELSVMVEAKNQNAAIKKTKKSLSTLHKIRGPRKEGTVWICEYKAPSILSIVASTFP